MSLLADDRPTIVPAAWPSIEELCPVRALSYPAAPNTDERPTMIPVDPTGESVSRPSAPHTHRYAPHSLYVTHVSCHCGVTSPRGFVERNFPEQLVQLGGAS